MTNNYPVTNKYPGKICASLAESTIDASLARARSVEPFADVIEIRLDAIEAPAIDPFVQALSKPILFTNRAHWEGGAFQGSEKERLDLLYEAIERKASYVDIELKTDDTLKIPLIKAAQVQGCKTIISWHSFQSTPSSQALLSILQEQYRSGAAIGKIVTMAHNYQDVLRVLDLQSKACELDFPLIAFCMGSYGTVSRVATLGLGGYMTYASADLERPTAPGQLAAPAIRNILEEIYRGA